MLFSVQCFYKQNIKYSRDICIKIVRIKLTDLKVFCSGSICKIDTKFCGRINKIGNEVFWKSSSKSHRYGNMGTQCNSKESLRKCRIYTEIFFLFNTFKSDSMRPPF